MVTRYDNLDFSRFDVILELTKNETTLIINLLQKIPVVPQSLGYQCSKNILKQIMEKREEKYAKQKL